MESSKLLQLIQQRHEQELELLNLADSMVASATNMKGQGYDVFLQTRQEFKEKLHEAMSGTIKEMPFAY